MQALWMLFASLCFATMGLLIKLASQDGAQLGDVIFFRGVVPAVGIAWWALATRRTLRSPVAHFHMRRNVFGITAMWLGFFATTQLPLATAVTLMYTSPLFIVLFMHFGYQHKSNHFEKASIAVGFLGVVAVLEPVLDSDQLWVALCGLGGGAVAALAYLQLRNLGQVNEPEWRTVLYFATTASLCGLPVSLMQSEVPVYWAQPLSLTTLYLAGVGLFGGLGNLALTRAFGKGSTWMSASLQYSTILASTFYGIWVLNHLPTTSTWVGVVLITLCGSLSSYATHRTRNQA